MGGRGAYYKNKYGRKGGGGAGGGNDPPRGEKRPYVAEDYETPGARRTIQELSTKLMRLHGRGYPAYHDILGPWFLSDGSKLHVESVQPDPFAPPSRLRLQIPHNRTGFHSSLYNSSIRKVALCDYLARRLFEASSYEHPSQISRDPITVDRPGQQILQRSSVTINDDGLEARFTVKLPAHGRTITGNEASELFLRNVTHMASQIIFDNQDKPALNDFINCVEDQEELRRQVGSGGLQAFIPNGAILPRFTGISDIPLSGSSVVPFDSPSDMRRSFILPHRGEIHGMGIPKGVVMICGGGFHGKSTLLSAIAQGCYNHIPGDGREFVVTSKNMVSVEGEDGRSVENVNISPFISALPGGKPTTCFKTQDASGSTSMAAGVIEALELGADTLLFDEDTCATNFLIRDRRMQRLVVNDPISPLVFNIGALFDTRGCSSILVIGGCGDYCDVADVVLEMRDFRCYNITEKARQIAQEIPSDVALHKRHVFPPISPRMLDTSTLPAISDKVFARRGSTIDLGRDGGSMDLIKLRQLVCESQTRGIAAALKWIGASPMQDGYPSRGTLEKILGSLDMTLDSEGLDALMFGKLDPFLVRPRAIEVGMAINRLRSANLSYAQ